MAGDSSWQDLLLEVRSRDFQSDTAAITAILAAAVASARSSAVLPQLQQALALYPADPGAAQEVVDRLLEDIDDAQALLMLGAASPLDAEEGPGGGGQDYEDAYPPSSSYGRDAGHRSGPTAAPRRQRRPPPSRGPPPPASWLPSRGGPGPRPPGALGALPGAGARGERHPGYPPGGSEGWRGASGGASTWYGLLQGLVVCEGGPGVGPGTCAELAALAAEDSEVGPVGAVFFMELGRQELGWELLEEALRAVLNQVVLPMWAKCVRCSAKRLTRVPLQPHSFACGDVPALYPGRRCGSPDDRASEWLVTGDTAVVGWNLDTSWFSRASVDTLAATVRAVDAHKRLMAAQQSGGDWSRSGGAPLPPAAAAAAAASGGGQGGRRSRGSGTPDDYDGGGLFPPGVVPKRRRSRAAGAGRSASGTNSPSGPSTGRGGQAEAAAQRLGGAADGSGWGRGPPAAAAVAAVASAAALAAHQAGQPGLAAAAAAEAARRAGARPPGGLPGVRGGGGGRWGAGPDSHPPLGGPTPPAPAASSLLAAHGMPPFRSLGPTGDRELLGMEGPRPPGGLPPAAAAAAGSNGLVGPVVEAALRSLAAGNGAGGGVGEAHGLRGGGGRGLGAGGTGLAGRWLPGVGALAGGGGGAGASGTPAASSSGLQDQLVDVLRTHGIDNSNQLAAFAAALQQQFAGAAAAGPLDTAALLAATAAAAAAARGEAPAPSSHKAGGLPSAASPGYGSSGGPGAGRGGGPGPAVAAAAAAAAKKLGLKPLDLPALTVAPPGGNNKLGVLLQQVQGLLLVRQQQGCGADPRLGGQLVALLEEAAAEAGQVGGGNTELVELLRQLMEGVAPGAGGSGKGPGGVGGRGASATPPPPPAGGAGGGVGAGVVEAATAALRGAGATIRLADPTPLAGGRPQARLRVVLPAGVAPGVLRPHLVQLQAAGLGLEVVLPDGTPLPLPPHQAVAAAAAAAAGAGSIGQGRGLAPIRTGPTPPQPPPAPAGAAAGGGSTRPGGGTASRSPRAASATPPATATDTSAGALSPTAAAAVKALMAQLAAACAQEGGATPSQLEGVRLRLAALTDQYGPAVGDAAQRQIEELHSRGSLRGSAPAAGSSKPAPPATPAAAAAPGGASQSKQPKQQQQEAAAAAALGGQLAGALPEEVASLTNHLEALQRGAQPGSKLAGAAELLLGALQSGEHDTAVQLLRDVLGHGGVTAQALSGVGRASAIVRGREQLATVQGQLQQQLAGLQGAKAGVEEALGLGAGQRGPAPGANGHNSSSSNGGPLAPASAGAGQRAAPGRPLAGPWLMDWSSGVTGWQGRVLCRFPGDPGAAVPPAAGSKEGAAQPSPAQAPAAPPAPPPPAAAAAAAGSGGAGSSSPGQPVKGGEHPAAGPGVSSSPMPLAGELVELFSCMADLPRSMAAALPPDLLIAELAPRATILVDIHHNDPLILRPSPACTPAQLAGLKELSVAKMAAVVDLGGASLVLCPEALSAKGPVVVVGVLRSQALSGKAGLLAAGVAAAAAAAAVGMKRDGLSSRPQQQQQQPAAAAPLGKAPPVGTGLGQKRGREDAAMGGLPPAPGTAAAAAAATAAAAAVGGDEAGRAAKRAALHPAAQPADAALRQAGGTGAATPAAAAAAAACLAAVVKPEALVSPGVAPAPRPPELPPAALVAAAAVAAGYKDGVPLPQVGLPGAAGVEPREGSRPLALPQMQPPAAAAAAAAMGSAAPVAAAGAAGAQEPSSSSLVAAAQPSGVGAAASGPNMQSQAAGVGA